MLKYRGKIIAKKVPNTDLKQLITTKKKEISKKI